METLLLGFGRGDFTPDQPTRMNSQRTGVEVWHKLFANVVYFAGKSDKAVVIVLDVRELYPAFIDPIRDQIAALSGVTRENVIFATTHNHSSPDVSACTYNESVKDWMLGIGHPAILQAVKDAVADAKPVTGMFGGTAISDKVTFVRRYQLSDGTWKGIATANTSQAPRVAHESDADLQLRVVRFTREGGKDVILMNYQVHAAGALSKFPDKLNADFCGEMRDTVEAATGAVSVYLQGACGNTNNFTSLPEEKTTEKQDYRELGVSLANTALQALENAKPLALGKLKTRFTAYMGAVNHTLDHLAPIAEKIGEMTDPEEIQKAMQEAGINNRYERGGIISRSRMPEKLAAELNSIAIGDFAMAFCPHEMFDILGMRLRAISPYPMTFPCNYSSYYRGYMPAHQMVPHGEYEVNMCWYVPGTGESEILTLAAQLQDMKKEEK